MKKEPRIRHLFSLWNANYKHLAVTVSLGLALFALAGCFVSNVAALPEKQ